MGDKNWMDLLNENRQQAELRTANGQTGKFGLSLSEEEMKNLLAERRENLKQQERIEFRGGTLPKIIFAFCDSPYLTQENYVETLGKLQEVFYYYKNEAMDLLTDEELLNFMKEQFDGVCFGDADYLEGTCLEQFSRAVRAGYRGMESSGGRKEYVNFDEVNRWDRELYWAALRELE